ncbi:otoancorin [Etheostoma cragini]|uniref:otoancorin n=1 Tax=Etheostoma cragini TaxID=417921 RepID=UPI00155EB222|nr:otoancorin [Etheostoma cragini]
MATKGRPFFFLLIVACEALATPPKEYPANKCDFTDMAQKLMRKCLMKGYPAPVLMQLKTIFNDSNLPMAYRNSKQPDTLLSTFVNVMQSVFPNRANKNPQVNKMTNEMWNFSSLPSMIKLMRNSSVASTCYIQAFVGPLSWATLTSQSGNNMTLDDYDTLLWAAKPALQDMLFREINLPTYVGMRKHLKKMMEMLREMYGAMSTDQMTEVVKWGKEQITQNYFNCTMTPPDAKSMPMQCCKTGKLEWLNLDALNMMGPYISRLAPSDLDSSPKEQLCEYFRSAKFKSATSMTTDMKPSLGEKFLLKFQECFVGKTFAENVDKLGILACHYSAAPNLTPDVSRKLLSELNNCNDGSNPKLTQLKKALVKSAMSNASSAEELQRLGSSVNLLSSKQLSEIPAKVLKEFVQNNNVPWKRDQQRTLVHKLLGEECNRLSGKDLIALQSVAQGLPSCVLKHVKDILNDTEGLKNISKLMRKGQLMAMLQGLLRDVVPSELVQKMSGPLLRSLPLNKLDKANITSLDQVVDKMWNQAQAAFLAKKMHDENKLQWRLRSVLQGVTCKMIDQVADNDVQDMVQAISETPEWLSKVQAGCAARKLFATLEKGRADYFKTITEEEMKNIPTYLLPHLPPLKVKDLPDSVCPVFLDKMKEANLSSLPQRSPSRHALTKRALLCLANGKNVSELTNEDMSRLGPLLCELEPSQLLLMAPNVFNSSLQAMASCQYIPQRHKADIIQLVTQTFGDPSDWSAETMEALGPLLLLDDNVTSALPNKPWMKDVLYFLKLSLKQTSDALRKKVFDLITTTKSNSARKKRAVNSTSNDGKALTVKVIEELGMDNVYWTAAQLDQMSAETFLATLETLAAIPGYIADQLAMLIEKATKTFGSVSQMNESVVTQMGCLTRGFSNADLEKLPFSLDTLEEIAQCGWNESQMKPVWKGVAKHNNLTVQYLKAEDIVALNQFICGLNSSEIRQLNMTAFKDAVGAVGRVHCSFNVARQLTSLAVSAFGNPNNWNEAQVSELGNIVAGLDATELASLNPSVFSFLSKSCISFIPPHNLAALSVAQLEALGPDNAAMVTSEQQAALKDEQLVALERTVTGSLEQTESSAKSGAPSLSVEGISAFMKPLLFLLMAFLLL